MKRWLYHVASAFVLILCLCMCAAVSSTAYAATDVVSGYCGGEGDGTNLTWRLDSEGTLTISGTGAMQNYDPMQNIRAPWYDQNNNIQKVVLEEGVSTIGNYAFQNCAMSSITIPEGLTRIGNRGLQGSHIANITIPMSVTEIGVSQFTFCFWLINIEVEPENSSFLSIDGVLFDRHSQALLVYPAGRTEEEYTVPQGTEVIGDDAFGFTQLKSVNLPESITAIEQWAFDNCQNLSSITIPDGVVKIGDYAFNGCVGLRSVVIPKNTAEIGLNPFVYCTDLREIQVDLGNIDYYSQDGVLYSREEQSLISFPAGKAGDYRIPHGVKVIEDDSFWGCGSLTSIRIPVSVESIGYRAFYKCDALTDLYYSGTQAQWAEISISQVGNDALSSIAIHFESDFFGYCGGEGDGTNLTWTLDREGTLTIAGNGVMKDCDYLLSDSGPWRDISGIKLQKVEIEFGVTSIGKHAFYGCDIMTNVMIPNSVTDIGDFAFSGCSSLTAVIIPSSVTSIARNPFSRCTTLRSIDVELSNRDFLSDNGVLFDISKNTLIAYPAGKKDTSYSIPSTVTMIGEGAFFGCSSLTSVEIPPSVNSIWIGAFDACKCLMFVAIPSGVTDIAPFSFYGCSSLTSVAIPDSVTLIAMVAFYSCDNLTDIYYSGTESQWGAVLIEEGNSCLTSATIHYNSSAPDISLPQKYENVHFTYPATDASRGYQESVRGIAFDDTWLLQDSYEYNHSFAVASLGMTMAAMEADNNSKRDDNIKNFLGKLGFAVTEESGYYSTGYGEGDDPDKGTVALAISKKEVSGIPYLAIALRGGGYHLGGWIGNLDVGMKDEHDGFLKAARYARDEIQNYMKRNDIDPSRVRIWLTGYSRSAATANLLSGLLRMHCCTDEHIYTYTFATPNNRSTSYYNSSYDNIFNIVNPIDIVPRVPMSEWSFYKAGKTMVLPSYFNGNSKFGDFEEIFYQMARTQYNYADSQELLLIYISSLFGNSFSRATYYRSLQEPLKDYIGKDDLNGLIEMISGGVFDFDELTSMVKQREYMKLELKIKLAMIVCPKWAVELLAKLADVFILSGFENENGLNRKLVDLFVDLGVNLSFDRLFYSELLMQHWPETYMALMLTSTAIDMYPTDSYALAAVECPVDVEIYDEAGILVARTTTESFTVDDNESGETYTYSVPVVDETVTTLKTAILGNGKYFILPEEQKYSIVITANDSFEDGDTMSFSVTDYTGGKENASVTFKNVDLTVDSTFHSTIETLNNEIETCTLSNGEAQIEPSEISIQGISSHIIGDLNADLNGDAYSVKGKISVPEQNAILFCGVYSPEGQLVSAGSQVFTASSSAQEINLSIHAGLADGYLRVFVLDNKWAPLDDCITLYV